MRLTAQRWSMSESTDRLTLDSEPPRVAALARRAAILLALLFFLVYLPILPQVSLWRGDERYYTDAAVQMVHTGDYITPRFFDGSERFRKPGLLYWLIAGSYKIFGIHYLATRLPFLIAGALLILTTFACTRILFRSTEAALCAAAILASNPTLFHLSVRSTPDVILGLFMTVSFYGFLKILFDGERRMRFYLIAYGAAGLAVSAKGMLGLFPPVFAWGFGLWKRPGGLKARDLVRWPALVLGLALGSAWFLLVYGKHGAEFLRIFFNDQVGNRLRGSKWYVLDNLATYPVALALQFLPWIGLVAWAICTDRAHLKRELGRHRPAWILIGVWLALLFLLFVGANIQRTRYFLPVLPFLAAGMGSVLAAVKNGGRSWEALVRVDRGLVWALGTAGVLILLVGRHFSGYGLGGLILVIYAVARVLTDRPHRSVLRWAALAAGILVFFSVVDGLLRPVLYVSPAPALARRLAAEGAGRREVAAWEVATNHITQLRVLSGGAIYPDFLAGPTALERLNAYPYVICHDRHRDELLRQGYVLHPCGYTYHKWRARTLFDLFWASDPEPVLKRQRRDYYLGIRRAPDRAAPTSAPQGGNRP